MAALSHCKAGYDARELLRTLDCSGMFNKEASVVASFPGLCCFTFHLLCECQTGRAQNDTSL